MITEKILIDSRESFEEYYQSVATDDIDIQQNIDVWKEHTKRVVKNVQLLSQTVFPNEGEKRLAEVIALFHDIGRFTQYIRYQTFNDLKSEDHASISVKVVKEFDFFKHLQEDQQQIIVRSIENHNKPKLSKLDNEQSMAFIYLLKDANKLDVFDLTYMNIKQKSLSLLRPFGIELLENNEVSTKILKSIASSKVAPVSEIRSTIDFKLFVLSLVFDVYLKKTFQIISEKQVIQKIYDTLPKKDIVIDVYRNVRLFVENQFVSLKQADVEE